MARLIDGDTDLEMTRYNEAAQIKQYSGLSPTTVRGGMMRYDPITKSDAVYVDLPSGGKLRIGDRPVQMAQADTLTTRTDATAAAPAALVPTATPAPVSLRPTETPAAAPAARQPIAEYDAQLRASSDKAPTAADFEAGGYTAEEFAKYQQSLQGPEMVPVKLTPDQMAEYAQQSGSEMVAQRDAGLGENIQTWIYNALDPKREATGGVADVVRSAFSKLPGTENLDPGDLRFFSNLFTDFVDIGVSPVGAAMSMDEGGTMMKQGWNLLSSGDSEKMTSGAVDMTVGAALSALGVAEFVPYIKSLTEPVRGTLRQMSPQAKNLLADAIGASRAITQGDKDMLMEIFQPAGTPRSLGAGAVDVSPETAKAITAFHGSPHDFDAFDLSKIGTGEGAQVYGRGLYFSDKEAVAKSYRDALTDPEAVPLQFDGKPVNTPWNEEIRDRWPEYFSKLNEDDADAMEELLGNLSQVNNLADVKNVLDGISSRAKSLYQNVVKPKLVKPDVGQGSMYEVNIKADPTEFLDWDKPLNEQSAKVREVLMPFVEKRINQMGEAGKRFTTDEWMGRLRGGDVMLLDKDGDTPVSIALSDAGIPGIRYLDQNSRQGGKGTSNYVVLDDKLIDIVKKYGIAGLAVGAAVQSELGVDKQIEERTNGI